MDLSLAAGLYHMCGGWKRHTISEWEQIQWEIETILKARTPKKATEAIRSWRKFGIYHNNAMSFVKDVRKQARMMKIKP